MHISQALLLILIAAVHGGSAATCKIVGSGNANCRKDPFIPGEGEQDNIVAILGNGKFYSFDCRAPDGEIINGDGGWDHYPGNDCWVWEVRTDNNCCPTCIPTCWWL